MEQMREWTADYPMQYLDYKEEKNLPEFPKEQTLCKIEHEGVTHFFTRVKFYLRIMDQPNEPILYNIWMSASEKNYNLLLKGAYSGFKIAGYICNSIHGFKIERMKARAVYMKDSLWITEVEYLAFQEILDMGLTSREYEKTLEGYKAWLNE